MKVYLIYLLVFLTCALGLWYIFKKHNIRKNSPIEAIHIDQKILLSGDSEFGKSVKGVYKLKNLGQKTIKIKSLKPDCSCTSAFATSLEIVPKDSVEIIIEYDGKKSGPFQSTAIIEYLGSIEPDLLILRGNILIDEIK